MIPKILRRFNLKQNTKQRDCIDIVRTGKCYILPFFSVENIMRKGNTYVRFGWLFWYLEYFKDSIISSGYDAACKITKKQSE